MSRRGRSAGFTLVEVMIALAMLFGALVVLLRGAAANITATQRAQMLTAATELARSKMYDIEETLIEEGFQELNQEIDGDFSDEGWASIEWEAQIVKIELPNLVNAQPTEPGAEDGEGEPEAGAEGESEEEDGMIGGYLGSFMGVSAEQSSGAGQFVDMFRDVFDELIRKVVLEVRYKVGGETEELVVEAYFTNPAGVSRVIPIAALCAGGAGGATPQGGGDDGETGDKQPSPPTRPTRGGRR